MPTLRADSPVQYVKGVGPARAAAFSTLGLHTVSDLLEYFPFRHELEDGEVAIEDLAPGMIATVRGEITRLGGRRGASIRAEVHDGSQSCTLRWFNQPYAGGGLFVGATVVATGRVQEYNDRLEIVQPRVQVFEPDAVVFSRTQRARHVGVYRGNTHIKSPTISRAVQRLLAQPRLPVEDVIPPALVRKHNLLPREKAVRQMHAPTNNSALQRAHTRLAYEEFLWMELAMALRRRRNVMLQTGQKLHCTREIDVRIRARFPFALTDSQNSVVREIVRDLESGRPMTRLLQGDVGSGKTVVALYACLAAIANGRQAAIMAPTEILVQQHFNNIQRYLKDSRVRLALLRGGQGKKARAEALAAVEAGEIDLIVGTQALLEKDVAFKDLAVVVVDEQHKFGVLQRASFRTKGPMPHYLVMTATPIPRTLAMTVFGDLDVSIIKQSPPGRGKVVTKIVTAGQWQTVMEYVRGRLERGEQAYVVCPLIGEGKATKGPALITVKAAQRELADGPWRGLDIGLLHGSLRSAEKRATIEIFAAGKLHAVVATTVVEVGLDVANATIMVVEHADRYGLAQLHQLRGRIGRGSKDSLCVLIVRDHSEKSAERLAVMAETTDGFKIAEADLRQRGPGQLFGTRQHGLPELRVGDIVNDFALLEKARQDAFAIVARDPTFKEPENARLLPALKRMFGKKLALIDAA